MKFMYSKKRLLSVFLSVLTVITMLTPGVFCLGGRRDRRVQHSAVL